MDINHPKKMKIVRYAISGGMATVTNILFLFIFTDLIGIWYVLSAVLSYLVSFVVSFSMQKYWTFRESSSDQIASQAIFYVVITTINLGLNAGCIYLLVHYFGVYYLLAQLIISLIIAIESFFVYRFIFRLREIGV